MHFFHMNGNAIYIIMYIIYHLVWTGFIVCKLHLLVSSSLGRINPAPDCPASLQPVDLLPGAGPSKVVPQNLGNNL